MAKKKQQLAISNKVKFRKPSKSLSNAPEGHLTFKKTQPNFGRYLIQAAEGGLITKGQLEAVRVVIRRRLKVIKGKVWVLLKPDRIVTKRALETRMGRGKGAPNRQIALIAKGQLLYEIFGPRAYVMSKVFKKAREKLSVVTTLIDTVSKIKFMPIRKFRRLSKKTKTSRL